MAPTAEFSENEPLASGYADEDGVLVPLVPDSLQDDAFQPEKTTKTKTRLPRPAPAPIGVAGPSMPRLLHLDGMRAFAVICVVAYHFGMMPCVNGFAGVDGFFVLSGYLMTRVLRKRLTKPMDIAGFYERRFWRIYPNSVAIVLAALVGSFLLLDDVLCDRTARAATSALGMVTNFYLRTNSNYWFPDARQLPVLHMWSLAIEEQFYFVYPTMLYAVMCIDPHLSRQSVHRKPKPGRPIIATFVFSLITAVSFAYHMHLASIDANDSFYSPWARIWEFTCGTLTELWYPHVETPTPEWIAVSTGVSGLGLVMVLHSCWLANGHPGMYAVPVVLGTVAVLLGRHGPISERLLSCKPMTVIGRHSYAAYLVHWPIWVLCHRLNAVLHLEKTELRILAIILTCIFTIALQRLVEDVFSTHHTRFRFPKLLTMFTAAGLLIYVTRKTGGFQGIRFQYAQRPFVPGCPQNSEPSPYLVNQLGLTQWQSPSGLCEVNSRHPNHTRTMKYDAIVIGNSFASGFTHALGGVSTKRPLRFLSSTREGCGFMDIRDERSPLKNTKPDDPVPVWQDSANRFGAKPFLERCRVETAIRLNFLRALPQNQTVFLLAQWRAAIGDGEDATGIRFLADEILGMGHKPVFVTPSPGFDVDSTIGYCLVTMRMPLVRILQALWIVPSDKAQACPPLAAAGWQAAEGRRNVIAALNGTQAEVLDRNAMMQCRHGRKPGELEQCLVHNGEESLYYDAIHLNVYGQDYLANQLLRYQRDSSSVWSHGHYLKDNE